MLEPRIIKKIEKANLIGRGCGVFPTAKKWRMVRAAKGGNKYVICNVSESEPGVFKDRYILEHHAEKVIHGMKIALKAVGAQKAFVYLNPEYYEQFQDHLQAIIDEDGSPIELYQKPRHDYVGGEETALINSMEGRRVEPKLKPPYPTEVGFYNEPTLVNNCETFYHVSLIESGDYHGTKFYCISGDGMDQKVIELPENLNIREVLDKSDSWPDFDFFVQVGGAAAGTVYNSNQLNQALGGLSSIVIYNKNRNEQEIIMSWLQFFEDESCGQCVPCREGTFRLKQLMLASTLDKKVLNDLIFTMQKTSFCPVGKFATNAITSYWKNVKKNKLASLGVGSTCDT